MEASSLMTTLGLTSCIAMAFTVVVIFLLLRYKDQLPLDRPNHRSMHQTPIPRTGGIAILIGILCAVAILNVPITSTLIPIGFILGMIFFFDDVRGLRVSVRLITQVLAASALIWGHSGFYGGILIFVLCVLTIAWMTNVYNFMDGADGLAAGMTVVGFGAYAIGAWNAGSLSLATTSAAIAGAGLGFLLFNFHPAKIFLGDVGSVPIGFLAGGIGILGWIDGMWPLGFPAVLFSPFLIDATFTLARRLLSRQPAWEAHRDHCYQKLILTGFGHRNTALVEYGIMLICAGGGMIVLGAPDLQLVMSIIWLIGYAILIALVEFASRRKFGKA